MKTILFAAAAAPFVLGACVSQPYHETKIWCRPAGYDQPVPQSVCSQAALQMARNTRMPTAEEQASMDQPHPHVHWNPGTVGANSYGPFYELDWR